MNDTKIKIAVIGAGISIGHAAANHFNHAEIRQCVDSNAQNDKLSQIRERQMRKNQLKQRMMRK